MIRKIFEKIALLALQAAIPHISEFIRGELLKYVNRLYDKAEQTDNPYDNYLLDFLRAVLGADKNGES